MAGPESLGGAEQQEQQEQIPTAEVINRMDDMKGYFVAAYGENGVDFDATAQEFGFADRAEAD